MTTTVPIPTSTLDKLLTAQLIVAWAGEAGETPRLGWWRTDLVSEFGGEDLFGRLLPHTWRWATLQGALAAARRHDAQLRAKAHDPDRLLTLFRFGFTIDERLDERFQDLKTAGATPATALPGIGEMIGADWSRPAFAAWVASHGPADTVSEPAGRRLKGSPPDSLELQAERLISALSPLSEQYPMPHFRSAR